MFTGLVSATGTVRAVTRIADGLALEIAAPYPDLSPGESIAVDGACLTVAEIERGGFTVQIVGPTLSRTRFAEAVVGQEVNLERALRAGDRLGGHLVQGHVDGVALVERVSRHDDTWLLDLLVPAEVAEVSVPLGSITVDGVSLTINALPAPDRIQISLIPFTLRHTTLRHRRAGDRVHVEADPIGKHVAAQLAAQRHTGKR